MKKLKTVKYLLAASFFSCSMVSCTTGKSTEIASAVNPIIEQLQTVKGNGILFGHQDDLAYGMNWSYVVGESDVKRVSGDYPAIFGWELGGLELDHSVNLDSVPFDYMSKLAIWGYHKGGINTFSWHPYSPIDSISSWNGDSVVVKHLIPGGSYHEAFKIQLDKVAHFFAGLRDSSGMAIPFIFRPWHEMDGEWFWWGVKSCSAQEFKALFRFTIEYLKNEKGLSHMVVAYSPDKNFQSESEYLTWYPGDDVVDILGMDNYHDFKADGGEKVVIEKLHTIIALANKKGKLSALTETGCSNVTDSTWFTSKLGAVLSDSLVSKQLSYTMVWRNDPKVHFYFPPENHPAEKDFIRMKEKTNILLLNNFKDILNRK